MQSLLLMPNLEVTTVPASAMLYANLNLFLFAGLSKVDWFQGANASESRSLLSGLHGCSGDAFLAH